MASDLHRTTDFVMSPVQAPTDTPVLYIKLSDGNLSLARLEDIQQLEQQLAQAREEIRRLTLVLDPNKAGVSAVLESNRQIEALYFQLHQQKRETAQARALLEAVGTEEEPDAQDGDCDTVCFYCSGWEDYSKRKDGEFAHYFEHDPDCLWLKVRAFLTAHP